MSVATEPLLSNEQAAVYLNFAPHTLDQWRWRGEGPPFYRVRGRIRYRREDLDAWLESRRQGGEV